MNIKRAIVFGIVLWVLVFFEVSILMFGFGLTESTLYYVLHYFLLAVFISILAYKYFSKDVEKGLIEGIVLGIIFIFVGIVLDSVITIPLFVKDYGFLIDRAMLLSYLEIIILSASYGAFKK